VLTNLVAYLRFIGYKILPKIIKVVILFIHLVCINPKAVTKSIDIRLKIGTYPPSHSFNEHRYRLADGVSILNLIDWMNGGIIEW